MVGDQEDSAHIVTTSQLSGIVYNGVQCTVQLCSSLCSFFIAVKLNKGMIKYGLIWYHLPLAPRRSDSWPFHHGSGQCRCPHWPWWSDPRSFGSPRKPHHGWSSDSEENRTNPKRLIVLCWLFELEVITRYPILLGLKTTVCCPEVTKSTTIHNLYRCIHVPSQDHSYFFELWIYMNLHKCSSITINCLVMVHMVQDGADDGCLGRLVCSVWFCLLIQCSAKIFGVL